MLEKQMFLRKLFQTIEETRKVLKAFVGHYDKD
jgi:hypothetical protein